MRIKRRIYKHHNLQTLSDGIGFSVVPQDMRVVEGGVVVVGCAVVNYGRVVEDGDGGGVEVTWSKKQNPNLFK